MSSVTSRLVLEIQARVPVDIQQTEIIWCSNKSLIMTEIDMVDVRTILTWWVNAFHIPSDLGRVWLPLEVFRVCQPWWIEFFGLYVIVKLLICSTNWSYVGAIFRPIEGSYKRVVFLKLAIESVVVVDFINIDDVIVRADGKKSMIRWVFHDFTPFFLVPNSLNLFADVVFVSDCHFTHVVWDCDMTVSWVKGNCSSLLVGRVLRKSRGRHFLGKVCFLGWSLRDLTLGNKLSFLVVEHHNFVIITTSEYLLVLVVDVETPGFSFVMRIQ